MDAADMILLTLLAVGKIAILVHLRRRRKRRVRAQRMMRSLCGAMRRQAGTPADERSAGSLVPQRSG